MSKERSIINAAKKLVVGETSKDSLFRSLGSLGFISISLLTALISDNPQVSTGAAVAVCMGVPFLCVNIRQGCIRYLQQLSNAQNNDLLSQGVT